MCYDDCYYIDVIYECIGIVESSIYRDELHEYEQEFDIEVISSNGNMIRICAFCILGTNLICQRLGIVPSLTRQLFIRPEYEKVHTIYQRFSYTLDDLIR